MSDFDLRQLIHATITQRDTWDIDELVELVYDHTHNRQIRAAYHQALREVVRIELSKTTQPSHNTADIQHPGAGLGQNPHRHRPTQPRCPYHPADAGGGNLHNSRAALLRRSGYRYMIHTAAGQWKNILDCTSDDLLYSAAEKRAIGEATLAAAAREERLAKLLASHGVDTIRQLPEGILERELADVE